MLMSDVCLSDVCLSRTSGLSRELVRLKKTKIGTEITHVTRDSDITFKVKSQGRHAALMGLAGTGGSRISGKGAAPSASPSIHHC